MLLAALLLLGGCRSAVDKANGYEALYDQMMPQRAFPVALAAITKATALDESEPRRWIKLGNVQMVLGRQPAAYLAYQRAVDLAPDNIEALENLAILAVRQRDYDSAKRFVEPLLALSPEDPSGLLASGAIAASEGRYKEAEATAARMIAAAPDQPGGYSLRLLVLRAQKRLVEASELLEQRSAADPKDADLLVQLMDLYRERGDVAGVRKTALRLAPLLPDDPRYAMESVRALHAAGQTDEALKRLDGLAERYRFNGGMAAAAGRFWAEALPADAARDRILKLADRGSPASKAALGNILLDMSAVPQAIALLAPLVQTKPAADTVEPHVAYARALLMAGRPAETGARIEDILAFDDTNVAALLLRARLRLAAGKFPLALNDAQRAAAGDPTNEAAALLIGQVYIAMGNKPLAWRAFGEARSDFPGSWTIVKTWSDTALAQNEAAMAKSVVADFARRHWRSDAAWTLYAKLCKSMPDPLCTDELHVRRAS